MPQTAMLIIKDALVICGLEDNEQPSAEQLAHGLRTLNNMVKAYSRRGLKAWKWTEVTLDLVDNQSTYSIGPTGSDLTMDYPLTIDNLRRVEPNSPPVTEYPMEIISKSEYYQVVNRNNKGQPLQAFIEQKLPNAMIHVWPAPLIGVVQQVRFSAKVHLQDFASQISEADFPDEWIEALTYNLALRLAPMWVMDPDTFNRVAAMAGQMLNDAEGGDKEQGSVFLNVDYRYDWD